MGVLWLLCEHVYNNRSNYNFKCRSTSRWAARAVSTRISRSGPTTRARTSSTFPAGRRRGRTARNTTILSNRPNFSRISASIYRTISRRTIESLAAWTSSISLRRPTSAGSSRKTKIWRGSKETLLLSSLRLKAQEIPMRPSCMPVPSGSLSWGRNFSKKRQSIWANWMPWGRSARCWGERVRKGPVLPSRRNGRDTTMSKWHETSSSGRQPTRSFRESSIGRAKS